jgi:hypothetical protein
MITVRIEGIDQLRRRLGDQAKQVSFAASKALNATAKKVAEAMPAEIEKAIDKPTPFTKRGVRILKYANKATLTATVGFMDAQAKYMIWQIEGGTRQAGAAGLKLPGAVNLNEFGNIPRGLIAQLVAVANKERKLGKVKARRIAVSRNVELFYGEPTSHTGKPYPRGIYKRVGSGVSSRLIPIVVFPRTSAHYRPRFDFNAKAIAVVSREWQGQFNLALADALRTAR